MDRLLSEIGVTKSGADEDEFMMLQSMMNVPSSSVQMVDGADQEVDNQRKSFTTLAQCVVENQDILGEEQDLELTEEMKAEMAKRRGKRKAAANVLDIDFMRSRYSTQNDNTALPVSAEDLNGMLIETLPRKKLKKDDQQISPDISTELESCPLCGRSLFGLSAIQIDKHIDRCSRRGTSNNDDPHFLDLFTIMDDDVLDEEILDDEFEGVPLSSSSQPNRSSQRSTRTSANTSKPQSSARDTNVVLQDEDDLIAEEEEGILLNGGGENDVAATTKVQKDDWEEEDYQTRIGRISANDKEVIETPFGTKVTRSSWESLFEYQREGSRWLFSLFREGVGGILADEMGLGKTAQVATHFGALGKMNHMLNDRRQAMFLIVCPATVLVHWVKEMHRWAPTMRTGILHSISNTGKEMVALAKEDLSHVLKTLRRSNISEGVAVVTSYETMRRSIDALSAIEWTAVCLDEGHKIRNPEAAITVACKQLPAFHRLILSGTPIQNSLVELWSLFDFIYPGKLGNRYVFEDEFAYPIRIGAYAHATKLQYEIAIRCAGTLQRVVRPYLLRRKKDDLAQVAQLPPKTEQVLFCPISKRQRRIYEHILESDEVKKVISHRIPAFRAINQLRKLCNHPALVFQDGMLQWTVVKDMRTRYRIDQQQKQQQEQEKRRETENGFTDDSYNERATDVDGLVEDDAAEEEDDWSKYIRAHKEQQQRHGDDAHDDDDDNLPNEDEDDILLQERLASKASTGQTREPIVWSDSGKLLVVSKILPIWQREGHKVLIFCQTTSMLHIIEQMVLSMQFQYLRLDGQTPIHKRDTLIQQFNHPQSSIFIMLLTTRTGGVGISLTAANRIILFDPDWNPMTDIQARERAWRLGQQREVVIYRLITKGTIEEKIYHRQIFKLLLSHRVLDDSKQRNLFSKSQMQELFELAPEEVPASQLKRQQQAAGGNTVDALSPAQSQLAAFIENPHSSQHTGRFHGNSSHSHPYHHSSRMARRNNLPSEGNIDLADEDDDDDDVDNQDEEQRQQADVHASDEPIFHIETMTAEKQREEAEVYDMLIDLHGVDGAAQLAAADDTAVSNGHHKATAANNNSSSSSNIHNTQNTQSGGGGGTSSSAAEYQAHDRKLLRALFNGDAILSIYSHDYLEPGNSKYKSKQQLEEAKRLATIADKRAERAFQSLQSSSTVYVQQPTASPAVTTSSSTSSNSNSNSNNADVLGRYFGTIQSNAQDMSQSSSSLLATIRQRDPQYLAHTFGTTPSTTSSNNNHNNIITTTTTTSSGVSSAGYVGTAAVETVPLSIEDQLRTRLLAMFRTPSTTSSSNNTSKSLSTNTILHHFRDLGDQYAPLFRRLLRSVAVLNNGAWTLRAKYCM